MNPPIPDERREQLSATGMVQIITGYGFKVEYLRSPQQDRLITCIIRDAFGQYVTSASDHRMRNATHLAYRSWRMHHERD